MEEQLCPPSCMSSIRQPLLDDQSEVALHHLQQKEPGRTDTQGCILK